jgi:hypothetical protein
LLANLIDFKTKKKIILYDNGISGPSHRTSKRQYIRFDEIKAVSRDGIGRYDEVLSIQGEEGNEINITLPMKNQMDFVDVLSTKVSPESILLSELRKSAT